MPAPFVFFFAIAAGLGGLALRAVIFQSFQSFEWSLTVGTKAQQWCLPACIAYYVRPRCEDNGNAGVFPPRRRWWMEAMWYDVVDLMEICKESNFNELAPLTFCDLAACFSEEEWKLLHFWQQELYNNVMKEINQVLTSLGPLIATSVFSLRPKEQNIFSEDNMDLEIRGSVNLSSKDPSFQDDNSVTIKDESGLTKFCDTEGGSPTIELALIAPDDSINIKSEQEMCSIEAIDSGKMESIGSHTRLEVAAHVASIGINDEGETYVLHMQDYGREETANSPVGNGNGNRNTGVSFKYNDKSRFCKSASKDLKAQRMYERTKFEGQIWPRRDHEMARDKNAQWHEGFRQLPLSSLHQKSHNLLRDETYNKYGSLVKKDNVSSAEMHLLPSSRPYNCSKTGQIGQINSPKGHQQAANVKGRYMCTECGKNFHVLATFVAHQRIHTGERPYHCSLCTKRFTQKGALLRHQKMHTGERPHQCQLCEKNFNQKCHLLRHQKTHAREQQH